ncbi:MAG: extracellular solute-binding protein, partial [Pseudomonadota bacterium]
MRSMLKASVAALGLVAATASMGLAASHAKLDGTLRIISDMSNPAPRAVMEGLAADFDAMHPDLTVDLEIVDREAWKTQIRNALSANAPDVVNWYAANRMLPYVNANLFMDISDMYEDGSLPGLDAVKGASTAVVAFRVANNGALSNISLSRSSGSPKI